MRLKISDLAQSALAFVLVKLEQKGCPRIMEVHYIFTVRYTFLASLCIKEI